MYPKRKMINPIIFRAGPIIVTYYVLVYMFGFLAILFILLKERNEFSLSEEEIYSLIFICLISILVGARIFHVLFWGLDYYFNQPIKIFYIWQGGMSFHGGLLGGAIAFLLFAKLKKINPLKIADIITLPLIIFLALARIANFINQEIVGTATSLKWCVNFKFYEGCRHPVQLYAATGRLFQFFILVTIKKLKSFKSGFIFWNFLFLSGVGRLVLDFIREDKIYAGLKAGQWFSLMLIVVSAYILIKDYKEDLMNFLIKILPS